MNPRQVPDGIVQRHLTARPGDRAGGAAALLLLAALVGSAVAGLLGGAPHPTHEAQSETLRLQIDYPKIIRSGEFFEARISLTPHTDIADLTLAVTPELWREHTVNSMLPAAAQETFAGGAYRFSYGPAKAGETFFVKIAFQLNAPLFGGTQGEISAFDGETLLAALPLSMKVMP